MPVPALSDEDRKAALEKALQARTKRAKYMERIRSGEVSAAEAIEAARNGDPIAGRIMLKNFIPLFKGYGKAHTAKLLDGLGLPANRRLQSLGPRQAERLIEALG